MPILSHRLPCVHDLSEDRANREEIAELFGHLRSDNPFLDECPELDDHEPPEEMADEAPRRRLQLWKMRGIHVTITLVGTLFEVATVYPDRTHIRTFGDLSCAETYAEAITEPHEAEAVDWPAAYVVPSVDDTHFERQSMPLEEWIATDLLRHMAAEEEPDPHHPLLNTVCACGYRGDAAPSDLSDDANGFFGMEGGDL